MHTPAWLSRFRDWLQFGPNQIALSTAIGGTIATAGPLIGLQLAGYPVAGLFMGISGLQTSIADAGGPYRDRLLAMGWCALLAPLALFAGSQLHATWWAAGLVMFCIAAAAGLARALGQIGTSLGLILGIVFLVGMYRPAPPLTGLLQAAYYLAGALWTILVALAFWRLRPYKRLEQEVGSTIAEVARMIDAAHASQRRERAFRARQRAVRDALERARYTLGETRSTTAGASPTMARLLVLVRTASRLAFITLALHQSWTGIRSSPPLQQTLDAALREMARTTRALAKAVIGEKDRLALQALRDRVEALRTTPADTSQRAERDYAVSLFNQVLRHLDNAAEALELLFGRDHRLPGRWLPPLNVIERGTRLRELLRSHLDSRSIFFRHGLRVGVAVGGATAIYSGIGLRHGFWLPMTALIILQPEFGSTLKRALMRTGGTLAGVLIAGGLLLTLPDVAALDAAIVILTFLSFLLLRRNYGMAVACITPLVILLLDLFEPGAWQLVLYRGLDTLAGAALALVCSYVLWPQWERARLPDQVERALHAESIYLQRVLEAAARGGGMDEGVLTARRDAEIQAGNADAAFQRMLTEPRRHRTGTTRYFALVTYLQRLSRHLGAFAARIEAGLPALPELQSLAAPLAAGLEEAAQSTTGNGITRAAALPESVYENSLDALRRRTASATPEASALAGLERLLGTIISDVNGLRDAARLELGTGKRASSV